MVPTEMYSPHLSQRKGIAVREHRKRMARMAKCAAGEISFASSDGPVLDRPVLFF
jgi:hypothetical protein